MGDPKVASSSVSVPIAQRIWDFRMGRLSSRFGSPSGRRSSPDHSFGSARFPLCCLLRMRLSIATREADVRTSATPGQSPVPGRGSRPSRVSVVWLPGGSLCGVCDDEFGMAVVFDSSAEFAAVCCVVWSLIHAVGSIMMRSCGCDPARGASDFVYLTQYDFGA
ncbi:hypothetical protein Nepgr_033656 [Nepenthes gracilis]|uniref:Uncharacterized protein n=1 Tax=Nepenthes gracilis TaxID=150966 RepID=A0AAD3Y6S4_NEPGR|nr:hypothetical protein Nepgr_033656 [Nepenthes gracilis]